MIKVSELSETRTAEDEIEFLKRLIPADPIHRNAAKVKMSMPDKIREGLSRLFYDIDETILFDSPLTFTAIMDDDGESLSVYFNNGNDEILSLITILGNSYSYGRDSEGEMVKTHYWDFMERLAVIIKGIVG